MNINVPNAQAARRPPPRRQAPDLERLSGAAEVPAHPKTFLPQTRPRSGGGYNKIFLLIIRRVAVRETGVSRHHGGPIDGPLKPLGPSHHYRIEEGFKGDS